jgi:hypothetical protein
MFDNARVLNIVVVIFAAIGLIAVLGMRFCSQAMHLGQ